MLLCLYLEFSACLALIPKATTTKLNPDVEKPSFLTTIPAFLLHHDDIQYIICVPVTDSSQKSFTLATNSAVMMWIYIVLSLGTVWICAADIQDLGLGSCSHRDVSRFIHALPNAHKCAKAFKAVQSHVSTMSKEDYELVMDIILPC